MASSSLSETKSTAVVNCSTSSSTSAGPSGSHLSFPSKAAETIHDDKTAESVDSEKRLWIGNLDPKLTEFHLLKLVKKYGSIHHFDFLFHRSGPNVGLPRGYAFVEFEEEESASKCMAAMDGKQLLERRLVVRWAHQAVKDYPDDQAKLKARLPALGSNESQGPPISKDKAINAIEAKLRAMEREKDESFKLTLASNKPGSSRNQTQTSTRQNVYTYYKPNANANTTSYRPQHNYRHQRPHDRNRKPYSR